MAAPQNFRSAFNGFNREDVVRYLEYINTKHQNQVNQLTAEAEELRTQLEALRMQAWPNAELKAQIAALTQERDELRAQLDQLQVKEPVPQEEAWTEELDAYRTAERIERSARERAELVYHQASGVLAEAITRVDGTTAEITAKADEVMAQLTQLQVAVSGSKQALQDAASLMNAIRPNF